MTVDPETPAIRHVAASVHGRILIRPPAAPDSRRWLVGFHGYAQNADIMLELLGRSPLSRDWRLVAIQALHPFYFGRSEAVVANWMTRQDRELAIADNVAYVDAVLDALEGEFGGPETLVWCGFSQGVAMAYRAAALGRRPGHAVLAVAGDVPPDLAASGIARLPRVRMIVGAADAFYPQAAMHRDRDALLAAGVDASAVTVEGGHEWTDDVVSAVDSLLAAAARRSAI